ncbi:MAG: DedA family protein [Firmicutes bacterium]|nr:DedA family protein [Bacillota bacterium]
MHILDTIAHLLLALGVWGIFFGMFLESAYIPVPSEIVLPYAGYLVYIHQISWFTALWAAIGGSFLGTLAAYALARFAGLPILLRYGRYLGLRARHVDQAQHWFNKYGGRSVFFGRLLPVIRTYIALPAGVARMPIGQFSLFSLLGSIPFTAAFIYAGYVAGKHREQVALALHYAVILLIVAALLWLAKIWWRAHYVPKHPK